MQEFINTLKSFNKLYKTDIQVADGTIAIENNCDIALLIEGTPNSAFNDSEGINADTPIMSEFRFMLATFGYNWTRYESYRIELTKKT